MWLILAGFLEDRSNTERADQLKNRPKCSALDAQLAVFAAIYKQGPKLSKVNF